MREACFHSVPLCSRLAGLVHGTPAGSSMTRLYGRIPAIPPEIDLLNLWLHYFTAAEPALSFLFSPAWFDRSTSGNERNAPLWFQIGAEERADGLQVIERLSVGSLTSELISSRNYARSRKQCTSSPSSAELSWHVSPHLSLILIADFLCLVSLLSWVCSPARTHTCLTSTIDDLGILKAQRAVRGVQAFAVVCYFHV